MFKLLIKSSSCLIPGYSDPDGELITTTEILSNIQLKSDTQTKFDPEFVMKKTGIRSVAFTKTTADFVRKYWEMGPLESRSEAFCDSQSTPNDSLIKLRIKSAQICIDRLKKTDPSFDPDSIVAHIHISGFLNPSLEWELQEVRRKIEAGHSRVIQTLFIQQGCSGLFSALEAAKSLLKSENPGCNVLITADNNMMDHAHLRCSQSADVGNINDWLWGAIFGEGAGTLVVGTPRETGPNAEPKRVYFQIEHMTSNVVETEGRVTHIWEPSKKQTSVHIKAKEVSQTYLKHVPKLAANAIEYCGGLDSVYKICFHESNPRLLAIVRKQLGLSADMVPTLSETVGTLACVSAFSLLDIAMNSFHRKNAESTELPPKNAIAMALLGEAGGRIIAGSLSLRAVRY